MNPKVIQNVNKHLKSENLNTHKVSLRDIKIIKKRINITNSHINTLERRLKELNELDNKLKFILREFSPDVDTNSQLSNELIKNLKNLGINQVPKEVNELNQLSKKLKNLLTDLKTFI